MTKQRLAADACWNFVGLATPLAAAAWAIPVLLDAMGAARFGVLSLVWALIGSANLLDLGLCKALAREGRRGAGSIRPACRALALAGLAAGAAVACGASAFAAVLSRGDSAMRVDVTDAFRLAGAAIPFVTVTAGLRGVIEGRAQFRSLSILRALGGSAMFVAPAWLARLDSSAAGAAMALLAIRVVMLGAHAALLGKEAFTRTVRTRPIAPLLRYSGWLAVGTLTSQVMILADRYMIGAALSADAVASYAIPYEIAARLQLIPAAIVAVLFPALARSPGRALYREALAATAVLMAAPCLLLIARPDVPLRFWLGSAPEESALVLAVLVLGTWANACANLPLTWLHARGRSQLTAAIHAVELPIFLAALAVAVPVYGIVGAAWVWTARVVADAAVLFWFARDERVEARGHAA